MHALLPRAREIMTGSSSDQASLQNGPLSVTTQHLGMCVISLDGSLERRHAVWCR